MFALVSTPSFERQLKKFVRKHPDLKPRLREVFTVLERDPWETELRLHPLKGNLAGLFAVSVTYSYRLTLTFRISKKEILLIDIGSHDEAYR